MPISISLESSKFQLLLLRYRKIGDSNDDVPDDDYYDNGSDEDDDKPTNTKCCNDCTVM